mmetsp:Transcript_24092/g.77679  ORF Transcript_24092/g.77679 Transcript_24092/m.77679 type:complete len:519 (-) Transcript_24092:431-1987(-)
MKTVAVCVQMLFVATASGLAPTTNLVEGACVEDYDPIAHANVDFFPVHVTGASEFYGKVSSDYALLWDVSYHGTYKLLVNHLREETYVLWQCGTPRPEVEGADGYFEVPVRRAATTSTTYMPYFEIVGERLSLKAYTSTFEYVSSPCLRVLHRDGDVRVAVNETTGVFNLREDEVELTIADEWTVDRVPWGYSITDTHEDTVFQVVEYIEVVGLFFNREHEATLAVERILNAYVCLRDEILVEHPDEKKKIVIAGYVTSADAFGISSCPNWYCEVVRDAGGELLLFEGEGAVELWGSAFMSLEQLLELAADADAVVSPAPLPDYDHPTTEWLLGNLTDLGIPLFDNQGPLGHNDWFERRLAEPDAVLADYAVVLETTSGPRNFFRNLTAGEPAGAMVPDDALDAACPNPDAPYHYLLSAASDCLDAQQRASSSSSSSSSSKKSSNSSKTTLIVVLAVLLGVFAVATLAASLAFVARRRRQAAAKAAFEATAANANAKAFELVPQTENNAMLQDHKDNQ